MKREKIAVMQKSHNSFDVSCEMEFIIDWNGPVGNYTAKLIDNKGGEQNFTKNLCLFSFTNLYYHTTYKIEVCFAVVSVSL